MSDNRTNVDSWNSPREVPFAKSACQNIIKLELKYKLYFVYKVIFQTDFSFAGTF